MGERVMAEPRLNDARIETIPAQSVYGMLGTRPQGLTAAEASERLARYGANAIREKKGKPLILRFVANFTHVMALLLWVGGIMAFIGRLPELGWAVWSVVVINALFSFWQEFKAERATEALKRLLPSYAVVIRNGQEQKVLAEELVPGDVMVLSEGDHISADARLIAEAELRIDQSTLSGESRPVRKTAEAIMQADLAHVELPNLVFAGTSVAAGTGKAVVFSTGMDTEFGKIARLTQSIGEEQSPLQIEIHRMTRIVTILAVSIGLLFFVLSVFVLGRPLNVGFIFAVGMVVAFVPEGLLPTVTLSLAMGVQRMARRHALVKKLSSVETLGSTTVICTDKTGTLTKNEMTVRYIWMGGRKLDVEGIGYEPTGRILDGNRSIRHDDPHIRNLLLAAGLANNSRLIPPSDENGRWTILGDPTEAALRVVAMKGGLELDGEAAKAPRVREIPFESRRKRMSTIHQAGDQRWAYVKGAPRETLELCSHIMNEGVVLPMDDGWRARIIAANDEFARGGLRVLAFATRTLSDDLREYSAESVEQDLTFLGLIAMMDPPRPEVSDAVGKCHRAGIRIIMITGDYGLTAESIARRIGIVKSAAPRLVSGAEMETMSGDDLGDALNDEVIFARVAPEHKLRVVEALKKRGEIVAVTGDGVNDAPALKKADIGVAMGVSGTDVAKEAAEMVLTDDNFASIVSAIEEGRAVYANIKKFATYIFTSNIPEAWPFILQILLNIPLALPVMQVLAVDLGTDLVPALALGTEAPEPGIMDHPPRSKKDRIIDRPLLLRALVWMGSVQTLICFAGFFYLWWSYGFRDPGNLPRPDLLPYEQRLLTREGLVYALSTAMFFAGVVTTQIGNAFTSRTERASVLKVGLFSNRFLLAGILVELAIALILIYAPPFQRIFELGPLPVKFWGILMLYPFGMLLADEARKALMRRLARRNAGP